MGEMSERRQTDSVTRITRVPARGRTTIVVTPPASCGLPGCVAEMWVTVGHNEVRVHLDREQRAALTGGLWL